METADTARTLLLTRDYAPVKIISWQRALTLLSLGKVEIVQEYDGFVRSPTIVVKIPAVVRLLRAFKRYRKPVKFSRVNIYARDKYTCGYCNKKFPIERLTYDHVVPRHQGGKTNWNNIVSCCEDCNRKKGGKTPAQAGMTLHHKLGQPTEMQAVTIRLNRDRIPDAWRDYAYWTSELEQDE